MLSYSQMDRSAQEAELKRLLTVYEDFQSKKLSLNMARGKPSPAQLDMTQELFAKAIQDLDLSAADGTDCRNYGVVEGLPEMREIFGEMLGIPAANVLALGNSSLELMFNTIGYAMTKGRPGVDQPWNEVKGRKFLCTVPGYDRHFAVTEYYGFELVSVPITENGPDMDVVEKLCAEDDSIKGIWCVPKYTNPDGYIFSEETCKRLASMKAAPDFTIMWDNTYGVHHLYDEADRQGQLPEILALCAEAGNPDRAVVFASTSKMTFAGAGVGAFAGSKANVDWFLKSFQFQTIGPDKLIQLYTVRMIHEAGGVKALMSRHASILRPKFERVLELLESELGGTGIATWYKPLGGYFVSVNLLPGLATKVVAMCKEAGVVLTGAGATYPYKKDPTDHNIRVAPSFPTIDELDTAIRVFCVSAKIAALKAAMEA